MQFRLLVFLLFPIMIFLTDVGEVIKPIHVQEIDKRNESESIEQKIQRYLYLNPDSALKYVNIKLNLVESEKDTLQIATANLHLSIIYYLLENYNESIERNNIAIKYYGLKEKLLEKANAIIIGADFYHNLCEFDNAIDLVEEGLNIYKQINKPNGIALSYLRLSLIYQAKGNYYKALKCILNSNYLFDESLDKILRIQILNQTSEVYRELGDYKSAVEYNRKSIELTKRVGTVWQYTETLKILAHIYSDLIKTDSARYIAEKALTYCNTIKFKPFRIQLFTILGDTYLYTNKVYLAMNYYNNALELARNLGNQWLISHNSLKLAKTFLVIKEFKKAEKLLLEGVALAKCLGSKDLIQNHYQALSDYYSKIGDFENAYNYFKHYTEMRDSLFINKQIDITSLQIDYRTETTRRENELLLQSNKLYLLQAGKDDVMKLRLMLFIIALLPMLLLLSYLYWNKKKLSELLEKKIIIALEKQKYQQKIITHQASLTSLGKLIPGLIHEISYPIQNISLILENIIFEMKNKLHEMGNMEQFVNEMMENLDRIRHFTKHVSLFSSQKKDEFQQKFSIQQVVESAHLLVRKQFAKDGINVKWNFAQNSYELVGNPYKFEQVILNLVSNARDAIIQKQMISEKEVDKEILIQCVGEDKNIILQIIDKGIGIKKEDYLDIFIPFYSTKDFGVGQGLGLSITEQFVEEMRGTITCDSNYMEGTKVTIKIPVSD